MRLPTLVSCLLVLCAGSVPAQTIPPVDPQPWSYVAPPLEGHCLQTYRLYLPREVGGLEMPPEGWPVLVDLDLSGFAVTVQRDVEADDLYGRLLSQGIALVMARATPSLPTDSEGFQNAYGDECNVMTPDGPMPPDWPGHGLFHPPGVVPPDLVGTGIAPYDSPDYPMCEKDAVMLLQHVRHLARRTGPFATVQEAKMAELDHRRIAVRGTSAGAAALLWATVGPDRRDDAPFAGLGGQYDEPTQPHVACLGGALMWWPMFRPDLVPLVSHFGDQGHSEEPDVVVGMTLGDALPSDLQAASPLWFLDPDQASQIPMYLQYQETSISESYDQMSGPSCLPYDFCFQDQGLEGMNVPHAQFGLIASSMHPAWSGYTWKTMFPETTRLAILTPEAFAQANGVDCVPIFDGPEAEDTDAIVWLGARMDELIPYAQAPAATAFPATKVKGVLPEDGIHSIAYDVVAGTKFAAKVKRTAGDLEPALRLVAPDGSWVLAPSDTAVGPKKAVVKKVELDQTGTYRLEVLSDDFPTGAYKLRAKASAKSKVKEVLTVGLDPDGTTLSFDAVAGTKVGKIKIRRVKPPKGASSTVGGMPASEFLPEVVELEAPDGQPIDLTGLVKTSKSGKRVVVGPLELPSTGTYRLVLDGLSGSAGYAAVRAKLKRPVKGPPVELY